MQKEAHSAPYWTTVLLGLGAILLVLAVVASPEKVFQASTQGLKLWWSIIFPAMLPFLMLSEMLIAFGLVHGLGVLLEPFMRFWFRLPGRSGWVLALGLTAGFPAAAEAVRQWSQQEDMTALQLRRLTAIAHFCNPITILLVIGTGLLHNAAVGVMLLAVHWISGLLAGWITARLPVSSKELQKRETPAALRRTSVSRTSPSLIRSAWEATRSARERDGRSFGKLLGETVSHAVQTLMVTGGFIIFFSVLIRLLSIYTGQGSLSFIWPAWMEIHLGSYETSRLPYDLRTQAALISAVLGWGGLCGWLQITAVTRPSDKGITFTLSRVLHGIIAFGLTLATWVPLNRIVSNTIPAYVSRSSVSSFAESVNESGTHPVMAEASSLLTQIEGTSMYPWQLTVLSIALLGTIIVTLLAFSFMTSWWSRRDLR
ncbi:nucleoside recognition domain-containing protein [Paenibacillus sp. FSL M8-0228]|jgi:sporulation integral membrane protein YlbJ|uniref:nucleoside recognition domain-containing protein n=1 Tax=Paenibacillus TaxID=44249 RepID=UPI00083DC505|nr:MULTISPECIES: nucleoside recognition domain-containing protein [Paenibacillus]MBO3284259.1 nucleoside recognition protein [Paenibacillus polymyxa]MBP1308325.1 sporulation integral membrane protein YlbJ [Paenibacillus sp. 1182]ODB55624.1 nucleoside recognition protein [Paenibacillus polymyxa]